MKTIYQLRRHKAGIQPYEQGELIKEFSSMKELNQYWSSCEDRELLNATTRLEASSDRS